MGLCVCVCGSVCLCVCLWVSVWWVSEFDVSECEPVFVCVCVGVCMSSYVSQSGFVCAGVWGLCFGGDGCPTYNKKSCFLMRNISLTQNFGENLCFISINRRRRWRRRRRIKIANCRRLLKAEHILIKTYIRRRKSENQHHKRCSSSNDESHTHSQCARDLGPKSGRSFDEKKTLAPQNFSTELDTNFLTQKQFSSQRNLCQSKTRRKKSLV